MLLYYVEREWGIKVYGYANGTIRTQSRASRQAVAERHTMVRPRHDDLTTNVQHTHARCSTHMGHATYPRQAVAADWHTPVQGAMKPATRNTWHGRHRNTWRQVTQAIKQADAQQPRVPNA